MHLGASVQGVPIERPGWALLAGLSCALSAWIGLMTYLSKLPLSYGTGSSRSTIHSILAFWGSTPGKFLASTILSPLWVLYSALLLFVSLVVIIGIVAVRLFGFSASTSATRSETPKSRSVTPAAIVSVDHECVAIGDSFSCSASAARAAFLQFVTIQDHWFACSSPTNCAGRRIQRIGRRGSIQRGRIIGARVIHCVRLRLGCGFGWRGFRARRFVRVDCRLPTL